jgi:hypothetical protein
VGVVGRDAGDFNSLKLGAAERKIAVMRPEVIDNLGVNKLEVGTLRWSSFSFLCRVRVYLNYLFWDRSNVELRNTLPQK